jgi:hypothetical protein
MQNELEIIWDNNICELIHEKCHKEGYHNDLEDHMTLNTIFIVINSRSFILLFIRTCRFFDTNIHYLYPCTHLHIGPTLVNTF